MIKKNAITVIVQLPENMDYEMGNNAKKV